ncbi:MAG: hypothetical protein AABX26_02825 [Nanoarchaeota archaeon]
MTNGQSQGRQLPDFMKYQYGALAGRLAQSEESGRYAPSALEMLAGSKGLNLGEEAQGFIRGTNASEDGIKTAIGIYAKKFQEKRGEYKPVELASWYSNVLSSISPEDAKKITGKLAEYDETLSDINKKYIAADHLLSGVNKGIKFDDEKIAQAKKIKEKYQLVLEVLGILDNYTFEDLRTDAVKTARKTELNGLASRL